MRAVKFAQEFLLGFSGFAGFAGFALLNICFNLFIVSRGSKEKEHPEDAFEVRIPDVIYITSTKSFKGHSRLN